MQTTVESRTQNELCKTPFLIVHPAVLICFVLGYVFIFKGWGVTNIARSVRDGENVHPQLGQSLSPLNNGIG